MYLLIPTSNHNAEALNRASARLCIFWFLHQTTTQVFHYRLGISCVSFDSYIKPQLPSCQDARNACCVSFDSYIKPQQPLVCRMMMPSCVSFDSYIKPQLIVSLIHLVICCVSFDSYIKPQQPLMCRMMMPVVYLLIPTSNHNSLGVENPLSPLCIFWFLHQTTTHPFMDRC